MFKLSGVIAGGIFGIIGIFFFYYLGVQDTQGKPCFAEYIIREGERFHCLNEPLKRGNNWYTLVQKKEGGQAYTLIFQEKPPQEGMAVFIYDNKGGRILFLPLNEIPGTKP